MLCKCTMKMHNFICTQHATMCKIDKYHQNLQNTSVCMFTLVRFDTRSLNYVTGEPNKNFFSYIILLKELLLDLGPSGPNFITSCNGSFEIKEFLNCFPEPFPLPPPPRKWGPENYKGCIFHLRGKKLPLIHRSSPGEMR